MTIDSSFLEEGYKIVSVKPSEAPSDMQGSDWHCYVIIQGTNTIRGYRQGSSAAVTRAVDEIVAQLNERRTGKRGRTHLVMSSSKTTAN